MMREWLQEDAAVATKRAGGKVSVQTVDTHLMDPVV